MEQHGLGHTYAAETGFRISLDPDTVRAPDAAFVSHERLQTLETMDGTGGYLPLAPDLVVEVVSPSDTFSDVESKAASWLDTGTKTVIVADPNTQTLRIYRRADSIQVLHPGDVFDAGDIVPGWTLEVRDALVSSYAKKTRSAVFLNIHSLSAADKKSIRSRIRAIDAS